MNKYYFTDWNKNMVHFKHVTSLTLHIYQLYRDYIVVTFSKQFLLVTLTILDRKQIKNREDIIIFKNAYFIGLSFVQKMLKLDLIMHFFASKTYFYSSA